MSGIVRVEDLCQFDRILTRDNGFQQLSCLLVRKARAEIENAVFIPRGRYKDVCAERDLLLSSHQRILSFESARKHNADPHRALILAKDVSTATPARKELNSSLQAVTIFFRHKEMIMVDGVWVDCLANSEDSIQPKQLVVADRFDANTTDFHSDQAYLSV